MNIKGVEISREIVELVNTPATWSDLNMESLRDLTDERKRAVYVSCQLRLNGFSTATANAIAVALVMDELVVSNEVRFFGERLDVNFYAKHALRKFEPYQKLEQAKSWCREHGVEFDYERYVEGVYEE